MTEYHWNDIGDVLKRLFGDDSDWVRLLKVIALAESENWELFDMESRTRVNLKDMAGWVTRMWSRRFTQPLTKRMSELVTNKISNDSEDITVQFGDALNTVSRHLGARTELLLPV